jgi:hypothetical protein
MTENISFNCAPELKGAAGAAADQQGVTLSELCARALAEAIGRPELGTIPRKSMGRPRKPVQQSTPTEAVAVQ